MAERLVYSKASHSDLMSVMNISDKKEKRRKLADFVKNQLKNRKWLLILDNVNNPKNIKNYIISAMTGKGNIIITTRNKTLCNSEYFHNAKCIEVDELTKEEKQILFSGITGEKPAETFLEKLPSYPLDISTAAYYVKNTAISCDDYLERLKDIENTDEEEKKILMSCSDYKQTRYNIISSTFDRIIRENTSFKILALALSLFDSQKIPRSLLERISNKATVDAFIRELLKHSIVATVGNKISIHRTAQKLGRKFLWKVLPPEEAELYVKQITAAITPYSEIRWLMYKSKVNNYSMEWFNYIPHYNAIIKNINESNVSVDCKNEATANISVAHGFILANCGENVSAWS
jgi:hypothetical protein